MIKHSARMTLFILLLVPLLLTACGGGSGGGGNLQVRITGLPSGVNAAVTVSGPGSYSQKLTGSQTLSGLASGKYTVTAATVPVGSSIYAATVKGSPATVSAGQTTRVAVSYKQVSSDTGSLYVSVSGVPSGVTPPTITIKGPYGYENTVSKTATLSNLVPGNYTVTAPSITWKAHTFEPIMGGAPPPDISGSTAVQQVTAGQTASVTVSYPTSSNGSLSLTINGLPDGVDANVTITGPNGFSKKLTASQTVTGLAPGNYTVEADAVTVKGDVGEDVYTGTASGSPVSVQEGYTASANVSYTTTTGDLKVTIGGLPEGTNANVMVTGPNDYRQRLTEDTVLAGLAPGHYTVSADAINVGNKTYTPTVIGGSPATISADATTDASVAYNPPSTGSLSVTISGLPQGVAANVAVTGPGGYNQPLTGTAVLSGLAPGSYTITADNKIAGGFTYTPTVHGSPATVTAGQTADASVDYAPVTGSLEVTISSPSGVTPNVTITGPAPDNSFTQTIHATQPLSDLAPGTYTITAEDVTTSGPNSETYSAAGSTVQVNAGPPAAQASVVYNQATGDLTVNINGSALPSGAEANVSVSGPNGYDSGRLTSTTTLHNLVPGSYTITAEDITTDGPNSETYHGTVTGSPATVSAGATAQSSVTYAQSTGDLTVNIGGLPDDATPDVTLTYPDNHTQPLTQTTPLTNLTPGSYTVTAANVTVGSYIYIATITGSPAAVDPEQPATITVNYQETGNLHVDIDSSALPPGTDASVTVSGPNSYSQALTATQTLTGLVLGSYTITAEDVTTDGPNSETYSGAVTGSPATVSAGATTQSSVTYAQSTGDLTVNISGLPPRVDAAVTITGPNNYSQTLTATQTLTNLTPGTYSVTADPVTAGIFTLTPTVTGSPATVAAGGTAGPVSVHYSLPPP